MPMTCSRILILFAHLTTPILPHSRTTKTKPLTIQTLQFLKTQILNVMMTKRTTLMITQLKNY